MNLIAYTVTDLLAQLEAGTISSVEITQAYLDRIEAYDQKVGAFLSINGDVALQRARDIDHRRASGQSIGQLGGLPVAIKDNLCVKDSPTTCASRMLKTFRPPYNATIVEKLQAADAVLIGKTNLDEFAMGSSTENSALQQTHNPWNLKHVPGGSSGGAAACIAASMAPLSVGSDTGGSIRQPAAFCGVVGLKPTYGRVSRFGLVAFASSLDQIGPLARTAEDAAILLEVISGHDTADSTSVNENVPLYTKNVRQPLHSLRIGLADEHFGNGLDPEIETALLDVVHVYDKLGATIESVKLPHSKYAVATYYVIAPCEASSNLARYDGVHYGYRTDEQKMQAELKQQRKELQESGDDLNLAKLDSALVRMYRQSRSEAFGSEVKRRIMLGTYALSEGYYDAYYLKALKVRRLIRRAYDETFKNFDMILGPVTPTAAYPLGEKADDPLSMYLGDLYTVSANLAGIPAISIPCGYTKTGLPIGFQLQGPALAEDSLLRAAHMYQQQTNWHQHRPNLDE